MELQFNTQNIELLHAEIGLWRIKQFFSPALLAYIDRHITSQEFVLRESDFVGAKPIFSEMVFTSSHTKMLYILMQDQILIESLAKLTDLPQLKSTVSRVYKFLPTEGNAFGWHNDFCFGRTLGFSVNLTQKPFEGGEFMIRKKHDHSVHAEYQNLGYGDAILFKISAELEHCVSPLKGVEPRLAYAGWFTT